MEMKSFADWEKWSRLAREDPEGFEQARSAAIEKLIMSQPPETRLRSRQLQWKIDAIRQTSPNSLAVCVRLYDMLMETVYGPEGLVETCRSLTGEVTTFGTTNPPGKKARVLEFRKNNTRRQKIPPQH